MTRFPTRDDWPAARRVAGLTSDGHTDMFAFELEVSLLRHVAPDLLRDGIETSDHRVGDRTLLLVHRMAAYTGSGVIGVPSAGTAAKGRAILGNLVGTFRTHLAALTAGG